MVCCAVAEASLPFHRSRCDYANRKPCEKLGAPTFLDLTVGRVIGTGKLGLNRAFQRDRHDIFVEEQAGSEA
jgi:hypothetical protein